MVKFLQKRIVNYRDLWSKALLNDLKEAATCEVITVCRLPCHRCPYLVDKIDTKKIKLKGLNAYSIKLIKAKYGPLLLSITAPEIDNWLRLNNLPHMSHKQMLIRMRWASRNRYRFVNFGSKLTSNKS